jgi:glycosyltransferase involved in cell wall biosynthesis
VRALHVLRQDHLTRPGGDLVHLHAHVRALRLHGVDAVAATWDEAPATVDIVHLYNLDLPISLARHAREARSRWPRARVVITPIFWPWNVAMVARSGDPTVWYRALRNGLKAWSTWLPARRALSAADAVTPLSNREAVLLRGYYRIPPSRSWRQTRTGVWLSEWDVDGEARRDRTALLAPLGVDADVRSVVACVARLEPLKNQLTLVRAVARLDGAALLLVGGGRDRRYAERVVALGRRMLAGRFAWLGAVPGPEVRRVLAHADVHALTSFREVASISCLEAAAAGCGVVMTRWSSAEEYLGDGVHLCSPDSAAEVAAAIAAATSDPRRVALRRRVERLDWSEVGADLVEISRSLG